MRAKRKDLVDAAVIRWPEHRWNEAEYHRGAFHVVLIAPGGPSLRVTVGQRGRERSHREASVLMALKAARFAVPIPQVVNGPHWDPSLRTWMTSLTTVPGLPATDLTDGSPHRISAYADALNTLRAASSTLVGSLPPARAWCGGESWPEVVKRDLVPRLETHIGVIAEERIENLLQVERAVTPVLCHGDFGPHNILWAEDSVASLLDFDHACIADPAIDLAPLISFHGVSKVTSLGSQDEIRRAMIHRATLPLQVAAAAHLAGLDQLRDHALANFERRAADGKLFDPEGTTPD